VLLSGFLSFFPPVPDGKEEDECLRVLGIEFLDGGLAVLQAGAAVDAKELHRAAAQFLRGSSGGAAGAV
jgi:hypothetical protein